MLLAFALSVNAVCAQGILGLIELSRKADGGDAVAQYQMGRICETGNGVEQNYGKAFEYYSKAAAQGLAAGQYALGFCYSEGRGVAQDYGQAVQWYMKAAAQGEAAAQYALGSCYYSGKGVAQDYGQAAKLYMKAAAQGLHVAQFSLAGCYQDGKGMAKNMQRAVYWYQKASENGFDQAEAMLGNLYNNEKNYEEAFKHFKKYADKHKDDANKDFFYAMSIQKLGTYYVQGDGVEKNAKLAMPYLLEAATIKTNNNDEFINSMAKMMLGIVFYNGDDGIVRDTAKAYRLMDEASETEEMPQIVLGRMLYFEGEDNPQNYVRAVRMLEKARMGKNFSAEACYLLARCYRFGRGVPRDIRKADELQQEAVDKGWNESTTIEDLKKQMQELYNKY